MCGRASVVTNRGIFWNYFGKMEVYSLEDEDNSLFITQSDKSVNDDQDDSGILGMDSDFTSPLCSFVSHNVPHYLDILDEEGDFDIPSSQMNEEKEEKGSR